MCSAFPLPWQLCYLCHMKDRVSVIYDNLTHLNKQPETDPGSVIESVIGSVMSCWVLCENEKYFRQRVVLDPSRMSLYECVTNILGFDGLGRLCYSIQAFPDDGQNLRSTSANVFSDSPIRSILVSSIAWIFCSRHTHTELVCVFLNRELRDQESHHANCLLGCVYAVTSFA